MKKFISKVMIGIMLASTLAPTAPVHAKTVQKDDNAAYEQSTAEAKMTAAQLRAALAAAKEDTAKKKKVMESAYARARVAVTRERQGSYGFFKQCGYQDACNVLTDRSQWVAQYTKIGQKGDATSLANLKATVAFLKECNSLRKQEGVDPQRTSSSLSDLKVSMELMAISEVQCNWSSYNEAHSGRYNVGENLAWGYSDPFSGWYSEERNLWINGNRTFYDVGHYLNICNATYGITGFAVNQYGRFGVTHEQSFYFSSTGSDVMTVRQFEAKLNAYCKSLSSAKTTYAKAKTAYQQAVAYQRQLQEQVNALPTTYKITYVLNGGVNDAGNPATYKNTSPTFSLKAAKKRGYSFAGWYSDAQFKNKVTQIVKGTRGNKTLYAKWAKKKYTITYELNGGVNNSANPSAYTVTSSTIVLKNPVRKGYVFKGWYSDATYKTRVTEIGKGSIGNKTLYAKWVKNS